MPLGAFILRRLGLGILSMLGVSVLVFLFLHLIPGDAVDHLAGGEATPDQRAKIEKCMGLQGSLWDQYTRYLGHVVDGTLGHQCPDPESKPTVIRVKAMPNANSAGIVPGGMKRTRSAEAASQTSRP